MKCVYGWVGVRYIITKFLGWIGYRTLLPIRALKRAGSSDLAVMQGSGHYRDNWRWQKDFLGPLFKSLVTIQVSTSGTWAPIGLQNGGN